MSVNVKITLLNPVITEFLNGHAYQHRHGSIYFVYSDSEGFIMIAPKDSKIWRKDTEYMNSVREHYTDLGPINVDIEKE